MNKIIVLILIIFIVIYFILNFDIYVVKQDKPLCKPIYINYNSKDHNDDINVNYNDDINVNYNENIQIHSVNPNVNQEMYNKIKMQLQ
jgi:hypothetical protein